MLFFPLINVKMPTIVGILTFMSRKNSILTCRIAGTVRLKAYRTFITNSHYLKFIKSNANSSVHNAKPVELPHHHTLND